MIQEYLCSVFVYNVLKNNNIQRYQHNLGGVYAKILLFLSWKTIFAAHIWVSAKKKLIFFMIEKHRFIPKMKIFSQIFFGSLKKRRIFALAFKETSTVDKTRDKKAKRTLNYFGT